MSLTDQIDEALMRTPEEPAKPKHHKRRRRRKLVKFCKPMVTDIVEIPRVDDIERFFYSESDICRFRDYAQRKKEKLNKRKGKTIQFYPKLVSETRYFEPCSPEERHNLYYTTEDLEKMLENFILSINHEDLIINGDNSHVSSLSGGSSLVSAETHARASLASPELCYDNILKESFSSCEEDILQTTTTGDRSRESTKESKGRKKKSKYGILKKDRISPRIDSKSQSKSQSQSLACF